MSADPVPSLRVLAATRADLWPLVPVVSALHSAGMRVGVSAPDALRQEVTDAAWPAAIVPDFFVVRGEELGPNVTLGLAVAGSLRRLMQQFAPSALVLLGDRQELLGAAMAAVASAVPIVHLHGGEQTFGSVDDDVRAAVSKLSHLHMTSSTLHRDRVLALGEHPSRTFALGAPGVDRVVHGAHPTPLILEDLFGRPLPARWGLMTYHDPTRTAGSPDDELEAIIAACDRHLPLTVVTMPGVEARSERIRARLRRWADDRRGHVLVFESLGASYPTALRHASVVIGNSSSAIIEAPALGTPVVDVGDRQAGRSRSEAVIHAAVPAEVGPALERALRADHAALAALASNPYGRGDAAPAIAALLRQVLTSTTRAHLLAKHRPLELN